MALPGITKKQQQMLAYGDAHPYSLLCADPRLGKSRVAIMLQQKRDANCLIVCPAYLVSNWKKEIAKWSPKSTVTAFKKGKELYPVVDSDFIVISYDLVKKAEYLFEWASMAVFDEIHNLKNLGAKRTQFLHRCVFEYSLKYFHGLTGTPLKNRVREFYSPIALTYYDPRLVDPQFLKTYPDEITFAEQFSFSKSYDVKVTKNGRVFSMPIINYFGLKNEKELKAWLRGRYIRIRAEATDLPPISYLDTLVSDIDDKNLLRSFQAYFTPDKEIRDLLKQGAITDKEARELRTSSVLPEHKRNAAVQKIPFTIKYVEDLLESKECCLIYSDHREPIEKIAAHFKVPAITGSTPASKRAELVSAFQSGKINIICATVGSLKEGSDLYRAKDLVLNDPPWVPGDILQVINRTRALGEKDPRTVHRIFGSPQDEKIWMALEEKMLTIDLAT